MTFIAYAPGLQAPDHDFSQPSESFGTFKTVAGRLGLPMHNLDYQGNGPFPQPSVAGLYVSHGIDSLQGQHGSGGIWVGKSVGGHMMLEAADLLLIKPQQIVLVAPVLGVQHKIVELAAKGGAPAIQKLSEVLDGKGEFPVPVANGKGVVPITREFFADDNSAWVRPFSDELLIGMRKVGFSKMATDMLEASQRRVRDLRQNLEGVGITILASTDDIYCNAGDLLSFKANVAPQAQIVPMPGGHEWRDEHKIFFRDAIAPLAPKRPKAARAAKPQPKI